VTAADDNATASPSYRRTLVAVVGEQFAAVGYASFGRRFYERAGFAADGGSDIPTGLGNEAVIGRTDVASVCRSVTST
jgi:hypothetical protein